MKLTVLAQRARLHFSQVRAYVLRPGHVIPSPFSGMILDKNSNIRAGLEIKRVDIDARGTVPPTCVIRWVSLSAKRMRLKFSRGA